MKSSKIGSPLIDGEPIETRASASFTLRPTRVGYSFTGWDVDFSNVTADLTVTAHYQINTYTLTYTAGANGSISGTSPQTVDHGANGSPVEAVPAVGYSFVRWSDGSTANPRTDTNVTSNITVTAESDLAPTILQNPANGHYYEHVPTGGLSWADARALAEQRSHLGLSGHLATVTSQSEWDFIRTHVYTSTQDTVFIGGSDAEVEGEWRWVTGPEGKLDDGRGLLFWLGEADGSVQNDLFATWKENGTAFQSSGTFSTDNCDYLTMYSFFTPSFSCTVENTTGWSPGAGGASGYLVEQKRAAFYDSIL